MAETRAQKPTALPSTLARRGVTYGDTPRPSGRVSSIVQRNFAIFDDLVFLDWPIFHGRTAAHSTAAAARGADRNAAGRIVLPCRVG